MILDQDGIIELFELGNPSRKGWRMGICPYCSKKGKFGILFEGHKTSFNCFSGSCQEKGNIFKLLKDVGRLDLITGAKDVDRDSTLETVILDEDILNEVEEEEQELPDAVLPIAARRIYKNDYLENRGWTKRDFEDYEVLYSLIDPKFGKYVIFPVYIDQKIKGFLARYPASKEYCEKNNILRWRNSDNDFAKMLYGHDDIDTETAVLTEGVFAKRATENVIDEDYSVVATFGKKVSIDQVKLLIKKGVKTVILFFDFDAVYAMINSGFDLRPYFENVLIAPIMEKDKDPDDLNPDEINNCFANIQDIFEYSLSKVQESNLNL